MTAKTPTQATPEPPDRLAPDSPGEDPAAGGSLKRDLGITIEDLYRLTVAQYHAIASAGILDEDDPVELLEGWLVCKYGPFPAASRLSPPTAAPEDEERGLTLDWI